MKTLLGLLALVLYTFTMLAWGHMDAWQRCHGGVSPVHTRGSTCPGQADAGK